jgi:hypothetical protein
LPIEKKRDCARHQMLSFTLLELGDYTTPKDTQGF